MMFARFHSRLVRLVGLFALVLAGIGLVSGQYLAGAVLLAGALLAFTRSAAKTRGVTGMISVMAVYGLIVLGIMIATSAGG